jgi:uncharacterized membrane protein
MDIPVTEEQIQTHAYYLWEKDGCPEGKAEEYWLKAQEELNAPREAAPADEDKSGE